MKQARKHVRDAREFNNIQTRAVIKVFSLQDKTAKEIHAILIETLAFFPSFLVGLWTYQHHLLYPLYSLFFTNFHENSIFSTDFGKILRYQIS